MYVPVRLSRINARIQRVKVRRTHTPVYDEELRRTMVDIVTIEEKLA